MEDFLYNFAIAKFVRICTYCVGNKRIASPNLRWECCFELEKVPWGRASTISETVNNEKDVSMQAYRQWTRTHTDTQQIGVISYPKRMYHVALQSERHAQGFYTIRMLGNTCSCLRSTQDRYVIPTFYRPCEQGDYISNIMWFYVDPSPAQCTFPRAIQCEKHKLPPSNVLVHEVRYLIYKKAYHLQKIWRYNVKNRPIRKCLESYSH